MARFIFGSLLRNMPTTLDVSKWTVVNSATSGQASAPGAANSPTPGFRTDRIDFTGTGLSYDGVSKATGIIDTVSYRSYGGQGYAEQFKITDLGASYQEIVNHKTDIMPTLLKGDDTVTGNDLDNTLQGFGGKDTLDGGKGNDTLFGGDGNDVLVGGAGADKLNGGAGSDTASYASSGAAVSVNLLTGKASGGDAKGDGFVSIENLTGSKFGDNLVGSNGANTINGGAGSDFIDGGKGNDKLYGGSGNDTLIGGSGNDHIYAGSGKDKVWLGTGDDVLHFAPKDQVTTVYDFDAAEDTIDLDGFTGVDAGNVLSHLSDSKDGAVLDLGNGDRIVLVGVDMADLSASDFLF